MRRRTKHRSLTDSRIYQKNLRFYLGWATPLENPKTGKVAKWHSLCLVSEGEDSARALRAEILAHNKRKITPTAGDFAAWFDKWRLDLLAKRSEKAPKDPARAAIWDKGTKALKSQLGVIDAAFVNFNVEQIGAPEIAAFVDQWAGKRSAQSYLGYLSKFLSWCCRKGVIAANPAREVAVEKPEKREVLMTSAQYNAIQKELENADAPEPAHDRTMAACYMDLLYLFYQRGTEIRLLRADQATGDSIEFKPTKTERSSGARVVVLVTEEGKAVIARANGLGGVDSLYLLHDRRGQPYTARRLYDVFRAACERAEVEGVTLKDIRPMAASAASQAGYSKKQIQVGLAHADEATTRGYIRGEDAPRSEVVLRLPKGKGADHESGTNHGAR